MGGVVEDLAVGGRRGYVEMAMLQSGQVKNDQLNMIPSPRKSGMSDQPMANPIDHGCPAAAENQMTLARRTV